MKFDFNYRYSNTFTTMSQSLKTVTGQVQIPPEWQANIGFIVGKGGSGIHTIRQFAGKGTSIFVINNGDDLPTHFDITATGYSDVQGKVNRAVWKINDIFSKGIPTPSVKTVEKKGTTVKKLTGKAQSLAFMASLINDDSEEEEQDEQEQDEDITEHDAKIARVGKAPRNFFKKPTRTGN